jgi:hypothetical protein
MATKYNQNEAGAILSNVLFTDVGVQNVRRSNSFTPGVSYSAEYIVADVDDPFDLCENIIAEIYAADIDSKPTGAALGISTVLAAQIPASHAPVTFTFDSVIPLTSGIEYCLVLRSDAPSSGNAARWFSGFTNTGESCSSTDLGSTWSNPSTIPGLWFQVWGSDSFSPPATNLATLRRLVACADNKVWYET